MKCPYCDADNKSRVVDTTRDAQGGIRRRRECKVCARRFSTYERVLHAIPLLIKSNGDREAFDREKLIRGIQISCAKRPIPASDINGLVNKIETHLQHLGRDEVSSRVVGDMVIEGLKALDPIAYIRYAIVYLGLDSLTSVRDMLDSLLGDPNKVTPVTPESAKATGAAKTPGTAGESGDEPGNGKPDTDASEPDDSGPGTNAAASAEQDSGAGDAPRSEPES